VEYEVTVVHGRGRSTPYLVEAGEDATVDTLAAALADALDARPATLYLDQRALPGGQRLSDTPLPAGAQLSLGTSTVDLDGATRRLGDAGREVAVVGGLVAGASVALPRVGGEVRLGRASDCDLVLDDAEVSRRHAIVRVGASGAVAWADAGSRNGTGWRGYRITGETELDDGDVVRLGETVVAVRHVAPADGRCEFDQRRGVYRFNRPPRIIPGRRRPEVAVPAAPDRPRGLRFPLAAVLLPLLLAGVLYALIPNSGYFLIFLAFSPLMAVAHVITERRGGHKEFREKRRVYEADLAATRARLGQLAITEERASREAAPDPAALARIATGPTGRLFERRPGDDDFGRLRIGLTDRAVDARLTGPGAETEELPTAYAVPAEIDLATAGVIGVAGPRGAALPIARALLAQAAVLHAPHDLGVVLLTGTDGAADWEWASWLPHTLPHRADQTCRRMLATDRAQAEARVTELRRVMDERRADRRTGLRERAPSGRRMMVLLDGARRLRSLPGLAELLTDGPDSGIYALCLDASEANLPDECRATVVVDPAAGGRVRITRTAAGPDGDVLADGLPSELAERIALALAPIRVLGARIGDDADLPERVRYLDLAGLGPDPGPADVLARWADQPGGRGTKALIGVGPTGPVHVDLRRDGPHALVAGTSGAGKSELLQTLVASLALGNTPDALAVVLVDYKGGSAFADCRDLPHCVGMVTDLDGHLANRALASLSAELRRREAVLAAAGAKDIEDYWARTAGRLPRLVIVIDEFATLVEEVPEFVTGVVGIGMRGRSLGVHVVLATQRPAGVVNAEMRANVNLRMCLRVTRVEESSDVIDVPDAARISRLRPGRAYLRAGHTDLALVQAARIAWPRADALESTVDAVTAVRRRVAGLGLPVPAAGPDQDAGHAGETDLTVLVAAVRAAAGQLGVAAPAGPWLPPLPDRVTLTDLDATAQRDTAEVADPAARNPVAVTIGLADLPERQDQVPFELDLERTGPVLLAGMARSGRSTVLRTAAASLAAGTSPVDVHLYAVDYGGHALAPLAALPHCGACVDADEPDRVERLLDLLTTEMARRAQALGAGGHTSLREQRAAAAAPERLPYLILLIDGYEAFVARHAEVDGGRLVETVDAVLRRGPAVGIVPVLATDRSGFNHRLSSAVATRLVFRQADPDDLALFGVHPRQAPRTMPAGRAVAVPDGMEVQVALLAPDPDGAAQATAVAELASALAARWDGVDAGRLPRRVDSLPHSITAADVMELRSEPSRMTGPAVCTVGAGGDHLGPVDVDIAELGSTLLISGPPRSGRSTALAAVVGSLAGRMTRHYALLLCCPRRSPLADLEGLDGVVTVLRGAGLGADLDRALGEMSGPVAVVVDDAEVLADGMAADVMDRLTRTVRDDGNLVIAAGTTDDLAGQRYRGWLAGMRRSRCGLLLNPLSHVDGEVFELRLPRSTRGGWPPGRALLVERGSSTAVQIARSPAEPMDALTPPWARRGVG
jgi:DNA segregation ATPase FtsK/SpoIIIE, S-DNA-T family